MMKRLIQLTLFVVLGFGVLASCQSDQSAKAGEGEKIVKAVVKRPVRNLYYSGSLMPLHMKSVISPVAGRVEKLNFVYGQHVKNGEPLVVLNSTSLTQSFQQNVTDYLQKKSALANALQDFQGSQALYKAGVISREDYQTSQTQYRTAELNFYQARYTMEKTLLTAGVDPKDIEKLTLGDIKEIQKILQRQFKHIVVSANGEGIALFPESSGSGDDKVQRLSLGLEVKQGQLLVVIGDLKGLSSHFQVDETIVNHIKAGMPVDVTGSAFPNITLKGYIAAVSSQAKDDDSSSGSSEFPVLIRVPTLTVAQRSIIKVGMTAKIHIAIKQPPMVMLPIDAVFQDNGQASVILISKSGQRKTVPVVTGFTTETDVAIVSGVNAGDQVVIQQKAAAND
ncbi:MAG: HlyD family efflux transporter periplasmic adaptor subunit [Coxiellaceae bacterium]|nr:HlyD family efflux transporter periplasmic adaptor subunit [Coxiellaceae bacterium]